MDTEKKEPKRLRKRGQELKVPLLTAAMMVSICLLIAPSIGVYGQRFPQPVAPLSTAPTTTPTPKPTPTPFPKPTRTPYPYGTPAAEAAEAEMAYFSDAVFIGDSRTDGLRLYSGIKGATFLCYKGLTVFDIMQRPDKRVVAMEGENYTVLEALGKKKFAKVYISLGINELGYNDNEGYENTFLEFLGKVRELQPDTLIYLQNLAPVNPEKCKENEQAYWLTNERIAVYNEIYARLAANCKTVLLDLFTDLGDGTGTLPVEGTVDGVHFTKKWYQRWLGYLKTHTVSAEELGLDGSDAV